MRRRDISALKVDEVLRRPEQRFAVRPGREVLQSRVRFQSKRYLMRVFVDIDHDPPEVVTVYRTSQVSKYWRQQP